MRRTIASVIGGRDGVSRLPEPFRNTVFGFESPLNLPWSGFWRANYVGEPWRGEASAGYPLGRDLVEAISPPVGGSLQNGYTPADFGGVSNILRTGEPAEGTYIGTTTVTIHAVVEVRSAPAPGTFVFDDPCIIATENSATIALGVSSSGVAFGIYTSGGPVQTGYVALSAGYHVIQARLDGTDASVRVDGGAWSSVGATDIASDPANVLIVGADYLGTSQFLDATVLELGVSPEALTDGQLDAVSAYATSRYGLGTGIPCLVVLDGQIRQRPTAAPWGQRIIWDGAKLATAVSSGRSLVLNPDGSIRQATVGESVLVPP